MAEANRHPRIAITGGIACGKSLVTQFLNELGMKTLDADDVVHELIPEEERRKLAKTVFKDSEERAKLCARIHPLVKDRLDAFLEASDGAIRIVIVPLLFEVHWDVDFDVICSVVSRRETQVSRMMATRGYSKDEAEARMAAQMPVAEKAARSHYVIENDGSADELRGKVSVFAEWLRKRFNTEVMCSSSAVKGKTQGCKR